MKSALVVFADGFEEIEALGVVDVLRRLGVNVTTAALNWKRATGSHGVEVNTDASLGEACMGDYDVVVLPGGMPGASNLAADEQVKDLLARTAERGAVIAAICAAPFILAEHGLLQGKKFTMYPGFDERLGGLRYEDAPALTDGNIITGTGPGLFFDFACAIAEKLGQKTQISALKKAMFWGEK